MAMRTPDSLTVREAEDRDLRAILDIYNDAVLTGTATFDVVPRSMAGHRVWYQQFQHPYVLLVATLGEDVVGWGCLHAFGGKPGYRFSTENSVYVRPDHWRRGIGRALLQALLQRATTNRFRTVIARITGDNPASVRLHQQLGFDHVGREREVGHKFGRWLDVVIMQKMLSGPDGRGRAGRSC
jgi:phosphinothricin acetyltransferase